MGEPTEIWESRPKPQPGSSLAEGAGKRRVGFSNVDNRKSEFMSGAPRNAAAIHWRQKGANYALVGALPEAGLRSLADRVHAQVEALDAR
jgi:anti-sigma factor RsiW